MDPLLIDRMLWSKHSGLICLKPDSSINPHRSRPLTLSSGTGTGRVGPVGALDPSMDLTGDSRINDND